MGAWEKAPTRGHRRMQRAGALLVLLLSSRAHALDTIPLAHVAGGVGGATGPPEGFRASLDAGLGALFVTERTGREFGSRETGWVLGGNVVTGFGKYPTYAMMEGGWGAFALLGGGFTLGPALRVGHDAAVGGEAGVSVSAFFFRAGLRGIVIPRGEDVQIQVTLGLGIL